MNWSRGLSVLMRTPGEVASGAKRICLTCSAISPPSWMGRARQIRSAGTARLYTCLTATEVRRQLIAQKGYSEDEFPTGETISTKLNELGYYSKKVAKSPPKNCAKPMPSLPR